MSGDFEGGPNRTVFRPSPLQALRTNAGAPPAEAPAQAPASPQLPPDDVPPPPVAQQWRNPLMSEAAALLTLTSSVRSGRARIALPELHRRASAMVGAFDDAIRGSYSEEQRRRALYGLCSTVDDVALNLPNQEQDASEWARRSLVVKYFSEAIGGDRFWRLLDEMLASPAEHTQMLELYHACMAAGFEGRYRVMPDGRRAHHELMQRVFLALEHPKGVTRNELSPRWRGEPAAARKVGFLAPLALAAACAGATLLVLYLALRLVLAQTGQPASAALHRINPEAPLRLSRQADTPPPLRSTQAERIRTFLAPEIAQRLVKVDEDASTVRVRTTVGQLFKPASDQLERSRLVLFDRIGRALETEPGPVRVEGYTDSDRLRNTLTFSDNQALSRARAETVAGLLKRRLSNPSRVSAEGFGEDRPIASNATAQGKALNRRVEVVVQRRG